MEAKGLFVLSEKINLPSHEDVSSHTEMGNKWLFREIKIAQDNWAPNL